MTPRAGVAWRNDIRGAGKLTKLGTGELDLTGENSYRGGTEIDDGVLVAASQTALGVGEVTVRGGTLVDYAPRGVRVNQGYTQSSAGTLETIVDVGGDARPRWGGLLIHGNVNLAGHLHVTIRGAVPRDTVIPLIWFDGTRTGQFDDVAVSGATGADYTLSYDHGVVALKLRNNPH